MFRQSEHPQKSRDSLDIKYNETRGKYALSIGWRICSRVPITAGKLLPHRAALPAILQ